MKTHLEFMSSTSWFIIEHSDYLLDMKSEFEVGNIDQLEILTSWKFLSEIGKY